MIGWEAEAAAPRDAASERGPIGTGPEGTEDGVAMVFEEQARRYQELIKRASDLRSYL